MNQDAVQRVQNHATELTKDEFTALIISKDVDSAHNRPNSVGSIDGQ